MSKDIKIIIADEVNSILEGKEQQIIDIVSQTYVLHNDGLSSMPHSIFLRFPIAIQTELLDFLLILVESLILQG